MHFSEKTSFPNDPVVFLKGYLGPKSGGPFSPLFALTDLNTPKLAQPVLSRLKGWKSPAKGYRALCVCVLFLYGWSYPRMWVQIWVGLRHFDLLKWGCANLGVFGAC